MLPLRSFKVFCSRENIFEYEPPSYAGLSPVGMGALGQGGSDSLKKVRSLVQVIQHDPGRGMHGSWGMPACQNECQRFWYDFPY